MHDRVGKLFQTLTQPFLGNGMSLTLWAKQTRVSWQLCQSQGFQEAAKWQQKQTRRETFPYQN